MTCALSRRFARRLVSRETDAALDAVLLRARRKPSGTGTRVVAGRAWACLEGIDLQHQLLHVVAVTLRVFAGRRALTAVLVIFVCVARRSSAA